MNLGVITDKAQHPVVAALAAELERRGHRVAFVDPEADLAIQAELRCPADVYLLRSHDPAAIELARRLERAGALVVNDPAAAAAVQDRWSMSTALVEAGVPWPGTRAVDRLGDLLEDGARTGLAYPLVVKSRWSHRDELVEFVRCEAELLALAVAHRDEAVVVQRAVPNDGQDRKLYVIDGRVFALWRPSPLVSGDPEARVPIAVSEEWAALALACGRAFGLHVYGVDVLISDAGPVVCDVNSFPGFRGIPGAAEALAAMVESLPVAASAAA
jgi:ribosomal protein S6--L-glutamate ligase